MTLAAKRICADGCKATMFEGKVDSFVEFDHANKKLRAATLEVWVYPRKLDGWRAIRNDKGWSKGYAPRAVQFHPHGGPIDSVWHPARRPHVGPQHVW